MSEILCLILVVVAFFVGYLIGWAKAEDNMYQQMEEWSGDHNERGKR